jgi:probable O-glycosylation ligase (exosortase A-associated)
VDNISSFPPLAPSRRPKAVRAPAETWFSGMFSALKGVRWSLAYAGMLFYTVIITTYTFQGFGTIVMAATLIAVLLEPKIRFTGLLAWFGALLVWAYVTHFSSMWPEASRAALTNIGKVWLIAFVASNTLTDRKRIRLFMLLWVLAYALYPARGAIFNYFLAGYTIFGRAVWNHIYRNPNDLAALTLLHVSIAAAIFVGERKGLYKVGAIAALVVLPMIVLLTQSRGAFVGLMLFGAVAFTTHRRKARLIGFAAILLVAAWLLLPSSAWDRFSMVSAIGKGGSEVLEELDDHGSAAQRYEIWDTAERIIADNPVSGVGWGNYARANAWYSRELGARDAHSTYYNLISEVGFVGFAIFVCLIGTVLLRAERTRRSIQSWDPIRAQQIRYLELGLIGFLAAGIFASYAKLTFLYLHMVLIWTLCSIPRPRRPAASHSRSTLRAS